MGLFTFLLEYDGGTYISQVRGNSPSAALKKWTAEFRVAGLTKARREELVRGLTGDVLTAISGARGVWCLSATCGRKLALMNIVETTEKKRALDSAASRASVRDDRSTDY